MAIKIDNRLRFLMSTCTAISVRGNRAFIKAFRELADRKGKSMADLVRIALDKEYGDEMKPLLLFFESTDYKNSQSSVVKDNPELEIA